MPDKTRILIPLDGSPLGNTVLLSIDPLVRARQAEVTLFHVVESQESGDAAAARLTLHEKALQELDVPTRIQMTPGKPAEEILRQASTGDFDLVAMATHGRCGMDRILMGSIAEEVVRSSTVPTLLCKPNVHRSDWDRIVVALDGCPGSEEVLADVVGLSRSAGSEVHLLQVGLGLLRGDSYRGVSYRFPLQAPMAYLATIADRLMSEGVDVVPEWREGIAGREISWLARELDAGLICMTTEGRPELLPGLDRSVAAEVIRSAPCPVYVRRIRGGVASKAAAVKRTEAG